MVFELRPTFAYDPAGVNGTYNTGGYYDEGNILESNLVLPAGGGRVYLDVFMSNWGSACAGGVCNGYLRVWEIYVDAASYGNGSGGPLTPASQACGTTTDCLNAFGTSPGPFCSSGFCRFAWINRNRSDGIQRQVPCSLNIWDVGNLERPEGHNYFGVLDQYIEQEDFHCGLPDTGASKYGGSFALDVPLNAGGVYSIELLANTAITDDAAPEGQIIPIGELRPALVWFGQSSTAEDIGNNETVVVNPGGGSGNPEEDALVSLTNESGSDGSITVTETPEPVHPGSNQFAVFGSTVLVDTSIADGDHHLKIILPFDIEDIGYGFPLDTELLWFNGNTWTLAVSGNTVNSPGFGRPEGDRFAALGAVTPDVSTLSNDLGDYGVFWNTSTLRGFVWANVDHTSAFSAGGPPPPTIPAMGNAALAVLGACVLGAGGYVIRRRAAQQV